MSDTATMRLPDGRAKSREPHPSRMGPMLMRMGSILLAAAACGTVFAQDFANVRITGQVAQDTQDQFGTGRDEVDFTCTGMPTCTGTYVARLRDTGCSNTFAVSDELVLTGVDVSRPGSFQGSVLLRKIQFNSMLNGDGTCSIRPGAPTDKTLTYAATWDGRAGAIVVSGVDDEGPFSIPGTFKADVAVPPPVFPMKVTASIGTQASATAEMQLRPQDTSTPQSVFVFAMAPIDRVKDAVIDKAAPMHWFLRKSEKDLPVQCVLAQLSATGQLVGVSASTLQSFVNGVSGSQTIGVTILNGVPTVNVGGATFFVGYGTSGTSMLNGGVNRAAVTVPGSQVCEPTAPQTGWWWNPLEDGRGFSIEKRGPNLFFASFLYDASGRSTWYVSSGLASLEGSLYVGDLLSASGGQTLGGAYPGFPTLAKSGTVTLTFNSASSGTLVWPGGAVPIQRLPFVPNGLSLAPMSNGLESGWWWNESEAGRGFFMEFQGDNLDVAGYMYDEQGNPVWYLTVAQMSGSDKLSFSSQWWSFANGQTLTGAWKPNTRTSDHVAPVTITFGGADTAMMTLPNGRTTSLKRHRF